MALVGVTGSHESSLESAALCSASHSPPIKLALQRNTSQFLGENSRVGGIEAILEAETRGESEFKFFTLLSFYAVLDIP